MVQKARALVAPSKGASLEFQDVVLEAPRPDEVLVEIHATGVCHGDIACITGKLPVPFPIVLGHEGMLLLDVLRHGHGESNNIRLAQAVGLLGKWAVMSTEYSQAMQSSPVSTLAENAISARGTCQPTAGTS